VETWDVVIVGAGAAGLNAARSLIRSGMKVLLLEARSRIGGRILTWHDPRCSVPLELGAEFVHGLPAETGLLLDELGVASYELPNQHFYSRHSRLVGLSHFWDNLNRVFGEFAHEGADHPLLADFEAIQKNRELRRFASLTESFVEGFHGADPRIASGKSITHAGLAPRNFKISRGYSQLVEALSVGIRPFCELRLNTVVHHVEWAPGSVTFGIESRAGNTLPKIHAHKALITIPVSLLQAPAGAEGAIQFSPPLNEKTAALEKLRMGPVSKIILRFRTRFWETFPSSLKQIGTRLADLSMVHTTESISFPTWWSALPFRAPILTGWAGGPQAYSILDRTEEALVGEALTSLGRVLGFHPHTLEQELESWYHHDWQVDPYSRGAYSYTAVGGENAARALAEPLVETLYFAGEATEYKGQSGTVDGALASGERAAKAMLKEQESRAA
jgi:monoamine oxidase